MTSLMTNWFQVKAKYIEINDSGKEQKVTRSYLVDAVSFTEAEARIHTELEKMIHSDFIITDISRSNISELFPNENGDRWFKAKTSFVTVDEESGKEKRCNNYMLVEANNVDDAYKFLKEGLSDMIVPFEIPSVSESPILDVFPFFKDVVNEEIPANLKPIKEVCAENDFVKYEYGAMSSKFSCDADNKLTAYAVMCLQYQGNSHMIAIYEPESSREDNWMNPSGEVSERLDIIFGGPGSFDLYLHNNEDKISSCYETVTEIV